MIVFSKSGLERGPMTLDTLLINLESVVQEYGADWVDPNSTSLHNSCVNVYEDRNGKPRYCIAAKVLLESFDRVDRFVLDAVNEQSAKDTVEWIKLDTYDGLEPLDIPSMSALSLAQSLQDSGAKWGFILWYLKKNKDRFANVTTIDDGDDVKLALQKQFSIRASSLKEEYEKNA